MSNPQLEAGEKLFKNNRAKLLSLSEESKGELFCLVVHQFAQNLGLDSQKLLDGLVKAYLA